MKIENQVVEVEIQLLIKKLQPLCITFTIKVINQHSLLSSFFVKKK